MEKDQSMMAYASNDSILARFIYTVTLNLGLFIAAHALVIRDSREAAFCTFGVGLAPHVPVPLVDLCHGEPDTFGQQK